DTLPAGATLRLPGPERARAQSALMAARNALNQSDLQADGRAEAAASVGRAEQLFQSAKYEESAAAADAAWRLLSGFGAQSTRFAVQVTDGQTRVTSRSGRPVRVEREGLSRAVHPGQALTITEESFPGAAPAMPELVSPPDLARLTTRPNPKGIGAAALSWQPVAGAARYLVEIVPLESPSAKPIALSVDKPGARVSLPVGKYAWSVRAVAEQGAKSNSSSRRSFELAVEPLKLEVKETRWK
ncbi:MAG TPA: peptidoglycan-binding protein LysM, partial [Myxococcaceae bacterium]|nr:peptidoglycan-binding protein LysM [Myxococcaceae bacterium]